nr:putative ribonuclease H-like domain-containing protein [Tanacetum cinerariifolium]
MTGNISYLTDFKEFDGGYVTFGGGAKCGKITGKGTIRTADESHVLLKVPRKNNMYSVDIKNIVPKKDLACLVAKATNDEPMLWHKRLGHIKIKNINKLVKKNLFIDSDYTGASLDRKFTLRGCQFLGYRLILWQCKKQTVVATSTTKAEYIGAASCYGQVL